eukprot:TRINITY_DN102023_c0_g1_i1.p1 TRINITY_DN102023_c0_g1~~TRINITY_DN102023_c0_g1_i1.p1  ORF type:complete len:205 (-),score=49.18 TRINITY_DN102023_c0_g1_i1:136-750(-)
MVYDCNMRHASLNCGAHCKRKQVNSALLRVCGCALVVVAALRSLVGITPETAWMWMPTFSSAPRHNAASRLVNTASGLPQRQRSLRVIARKAEEDDEEDPWAEDPNMLKIRADLENIWRFRSQGLWEVGEFMNVEDVGYYLIEEQLRPMLGAEAAEEMNLIFAELGAEEPEPGNVNREDFITVAGAFIYNRLYGEGMMTDEADA